MNSLTPLLLGFLALAGCVPKPDPAPAPIGVVYGAEVAQGDDEAQLWLTDSASGHRQQLLAEGAQYYEPEFTDDQRYLIVTRKSMSHTQGVIVFKRAETGYTQLDLKPAIGKLWERFNAEHQFALDIKYAERVEGYDPETESLRLVIGVFGKVQQEDEVDWHETEYRLLLKDLKP